MSKYRELCARLREGEFNYAFSISLKHKYVFVENAKVACSTLKTILGEWEFSDCRLGTDIPNTFFSNVHVNVLGTPFVKPFQLGEQAFNEIIEDPAYFKFAFVRNPYSRVLSAYLDKVQGGKPEAAQILVEARRLGLTSDAEQVSFVEFLRCLEALFERGEYLDKHWRPQSYQLFQSGISYNKVGRVESFSGDIQSIAGALGVVVGETRRVFGHETKASEFAGEYYSSEALEIVARLFADDFSEFNYGLSLS